MMINRIKVFSLFTAAVLAATMLPVTSFAAGEVKYTFIAENPGGATPYIDYSEASAVAEVWINGGKTTFANGLSADSKTKQIQLFETDLSGGTYNLTNAKNIVWGVSTAAAAPALEKGKFKDTSAKDIIKVAKGKLTAGKKSGDTRIYTYRTAKVNKEVVVENLNSFAASTKVAPAKIDSYSDPEFKTKANSLSVEIGEEAPVYFLPSAGTTASPLEVDAGTLYSVEVTKYPEYISIYQTSSGETGAPINADPELNESELELTLAELKEGFYVSGTESKSDTANGTATITVTCLNNGKKKTFNVTVLKPPVAMEAQKMEISYATDKKTTFTFPTDEEPNGIIVSSSGTAVNSGAETLLNEFVDETNFKEINVGIGNETTAKIKTTAVNSTTSISYSIVSGGTGSVSSGVYTVKLTNATARVKVTIKHGSDTNEYFINVISKNSDLIASVPEQLSIIKSTGTEAAQLSAEDLEELSKNATITKTLELGTFKSGNLYINLADGVTVISSGSPKEGQVLVKVVPKLSSQSGGVKVVTSSGGTSDPSVSCPISFELSANSRTTNLPIVVTLETVKGKSVINLNLITNYYVDSKISYMYFGGIKSGSFTKIPDTESDYNGATYKVSVNLPNTSASYTQNRKLTMIRNDSNSELEFVGETSDYGCLVENISGQAKEEDNGIFVSISASSIASKTAVIYVDAEPVYSGAYDIATNQPAETTTYKIIVTWP